MNSCFWLSSIRSCVNLWQWSLIDYLSAIAITCIAIVYRLIGAVMFRKRCHSLADFRVHFDHALSPYQWSLPRLMSNSEHFCLEIWSRAVFNQGYLGDEWALKIVRGMELSKDLFLPFKRWQLRNAFWQFKVTHYSSLYPILFTTHYWIFSLIKDKTRGKVGIILILNSKFFLFKLFELKTAMTGLVGTVC